MNNFVNYIIESGISLGLLSLVYFLFLRKETFFSSNRVYLLVSILFSAILPLLHLKVLPGSAFIIDGVKQNQGTNLLETVTVYSSGVSGSLAELLTANRIIVIIYLSVLGFFTIRFLFRVGQIFRIISKNDVQKRDGINFVYVDGDFSPYSFLNYLFVSRHLEENEGWDKMLAHETEHIKQGHTFDLLMIELISIFQWFNPFFWLLRRVIKENHEFMADHAVLNKGVSVKKYKYILVNQFVGQQFAMANNFNTSLIKTRLKMMSKIKSSKKANFKFIAGALVMAVLLVVFACENMPAPNEQELQPESGMGKLFDGLNEPLIIIDGNMATKDAMDKLNPNDIESISIMKKENKAMIDKYGDLAKKGIVMIELKNGASDVKNNIGEISVIAYGSENAPNTDPVFNIVEEMPEFPGGEIALRKFIAESIEYPVIARENGIQGKVYVNFVVEKDGSVGRIKVVRGVDPSLDREALRVVHSLPKWIPGKQRGENVAVSYTVPINFVLQ